tara:strand:- start:12527 stop:13753 length:1227 start_codon:yes stop_codon:yes gene_type:complete
MNYGIVASALLVTLLVGGGNKAYAETITLEEALKLAEGHPQLQLANADVQGAEGRRSQAGTINYNPELTGGVGPRLGGSETVLDFEVGLSQTLELGGKRTHRRKTASELVRAAKLREARTEQLVALRVRYSFAVAVIAKRVLATTQEAEDVASEVKNISKERLERGAGNLLEINLAAAGVGRARRRRLEAQQALINAEYELASAVGLKTATRLEAAGETEVTQPLIPSLESLVERAFARRSDLAAMKAERAAAGASVRLASSLATPNLSLGASYAHEEGTDQVLATLRIELPVWNRNKGGRTAARADRTKAQVAVDFFERELRRQVHKAEANYQAARKTVEAFDRDAVGKLSDSIDLTRKSFERGKISMLQFNILRTEFVAVRLAYLDSLQAEIQARFELERAIGETL